MWNKHKAGQGWGIEEWRIGARDQRCAVSRYSIASILTVVVSRQTPWVGFSNLLLGVEDNCLSGTGHLLGGPPFDTARILCVFCNPVLSTGASRDDFSGSKGGVFL